MHLLESFAELSKPNTYRPCWVQALILAEKPASILGEKYARGVLFLFESILVGNDKIQLDCGGGSIRGKIGSLGDGRSQLPN